MKTDILAIERVSFGYNGGLPLVLEDFSFTLKKGTVNAVLGANGAGKTTLLHLVIGLYHPKSGRIMLDGEPVDHYSRRALSRMVSLVPQREHVPFDYRVRDYVLLGRTPHLGFLRMPSRADLQQVEDVLKRLGLETIGNRRVNTLSGGEHQLVLIARALVQSPRMLLLDEPTSHLDLGNKKKVLAILRALARQGITILFTTHDPESASAVSDKLILMMDGKVLRQGTLAETFTAEYLSIIYRTKLGVSKMDGQKVVLLNLDENER